MTCLHHSSMVKLIEYEAGSAFGTFGQPFCMRGHDLPCPDKCPDRVEKIP